MVDFKKLSYLVVDFSSFYKHYMLDYDYGVLQNCFYAFEPAGSIFEFGTTRSLKFLSLSPLQMWVFS